MNKWVVVCLFFELLFSVNITADTRMRRWVDGKGDVHYDSRIPPDATENGLTSTSNALAELQVERNGDASDVYIKNRVGGPLEIELILTNARNVQSLPTLPLRQVLPAHQRTLISRIEADLSGQPASYNLGMASVPGDPHAIAHDVVYSLPLLENSGWELGQIFHGDFSHNDEQNRYAVDLIVTEGASVLAARDGVVMMVQAGFEGSGLNKGKYADRANVIRILHDDGSMAVYAHLQEGGVLVRVGQRVSLGQVIGISGNTGYSSGPHLHFCVQVNSGMRLVSIPFRLVGPEGYLPLPGNSP